MNSSLIFVTSAQGDFFRASLRPLFPDMRYRTFKNERSCSHAPIFDIWYIAKETATINDGTLPILPITRELFSGAILLKAARATKTREMTVGTRARTTMRRLLNNKCRLLSAIASLSANERGSFIDSVSSHSKICCISSIYFDPPNVYLSAIAV